MKICFICHGNICRSVAAELIAKQLIKDRHIENIEIFSRALSNEEFGNDIYPPMKRVLLSHGYKCEPHFARRISEQEIIDSDIIYYMDGYNYSIIQDYYPKYLEKFHLLREGLDNKFIADPWYNGRFDEAFSQIKEGVENVLKGQHS